MDFPVSRRLLDQLDGWVEQLARPFLPLERGQSTYGGTDWRFRDETPQALMLGKVVRIASALRAATLLIDAGYHGEAFALLRMVSDFADEVKSVGEGVHSGNLTRAQQEFVSDYFASPPSSPEIHASSPRKRPVGREEHFKAHTRLLQQAQKGKDADQMLVLARYSNAFFDAYVHGACWTTMELFRGDHFMLCGDDAEFTRCTARAMFAGKLYQALLAMMFLAGLQGDAALADTIAEGMQALDDEQDVARCGPLRGR